MWTLYRDLNAWPWRLVKFLVTGSLGALIDAAVLYAIARAMGETEPSKYVGACAGFLAAMTFNYSLNRAWTFRAREIPILVSYPKYALGTLGGLAVKTGAIYALPCVHYLGSNFLGIALGTIFISLASQRWTFSRQ